MKDETKYSVAELNTSLNAAVMNIVQKATGLSLEELKKLKVEPMTPPGKQAKLADLCLQCNSMSFSLDKKNPALIAKDIAVAFNTDGEGIFEGATSKGPFVNLKISSHFLACNTIGEYLLDHPVPQSSEHVIVEFSSPNTNKPQHLGHVRNNCLGDALSRIISESGVKVTKINLVNDRGIHICKSMLAYKLFGDGETPESSGLKGDHLVGKYYVLFEKKFKKEYDDFLASDEGKERFKGWPKLAELEANNERYRLEAEKARQKEAEAAKQPPAKEAGNKRKRQRQQQTKNLSDKWEDKIKDPFATWKEEYKPVFFNNESKLGKEAKEMLVKWEQGDKEVMDLWNLMNDFVFAGFHETYSTMGIEFDHIDKESTTYLLGKEIVMEGIESGCLEEREDGAIVCDMAKLGLKTDRKKVLLRPNGTTVYMTQDLGTACSRIERFKPSKLIYVVACEQENHFRELFKILSLLRPQYSEDNFYHRSYGMVNLPSGRMKSREGTVVDADDLINELKEIAKAQTAIRIKETELKKKGGEEDVGSELEKLQELKKKTARGDIAGKHILEYYRDMYKDIIASWSLDDKQELEQRGLSIALAALKFYMLCVPPDASVSFDIKKSLDFTAGKTGPYNLYMYARTRSIFRKAGVSPDDLPFDPSHLHLLVGEEERAVMNALKALKEAIDKAAVCYEPSLICENLFSLSKAFSLFFSKKDSNGLPVYSIVSCDDPDLKHARLLLTLAVSNAIRKSLNLLGIQTIERM